MFAFEIERRDVLVIVSIVLLLATAGCTGLSESNSEAQTTTKSGLTESPERTSIQTKTTTAEATAELSNTEDWNATVDMQAQKTSFAAGDAVFNGWNVSVEVTSVDGADEIIYVYEAVNVVEGDSTREGVVGTTTGDTTSSRSLSLLQRNATVTVYALNDGERKKIGFLEIQSSYTASWDGERGWDDSWRGDPPEGMDK